MTTNVLLATVSECYSLLFVIPVVHHGYRYCGVKFQYGYNKDELKCSSGPNRYHEPNTVAKDLDLQYKLRVDPITSSLLREQLIADINFLQSQDIMDYSLLLGIHRNRWAPLMKQHCFPLKLLPLTPFNCCRYKLRFQVEDQHAERPVPANGLGGLQQLVPGARAHHALPVHESDDDTSATDGGPGSISPFPSVSDRNCKLTVAGLIVAALHILCSTLAIE